MGVFKLLIYVVDGYFMFFCVDFGVLLWNSRCIGVVYCVGVMLGNVLVFVVRL